MLEIKRDVNQEEISEAFKRLAIKFNPHVNLTSQQSNQYKYDLICEAYEVLSNEKRKSIFDTYGEFGLKNGIADQAGNRTEKYIYLGNSDEISNDFFGRTHTDGIAFEYNGSDVAGSLLFDGHKGKFHSAQSAPKDVVVTLQVSLAEFYNGSSTTVSYTRTATNIDGRTLNNVAETHQVQIKQGYSIKTVLTFKGAGNQQYDHYHRSNLVVKLAAVDESASSYSRSGNNLIYRHTMSLKEALGSSPIQITTLDNRQINLNIDQYITPQTVYTLKSEGMPVPVDKDDDYTRHLESSKNMPRGNMYVKFNIEFPKDLRSDQKKRVLDILSQNQRQLDQEANEDE